MGMQCPQSRLAQCEGATKAVVYASTTTSRCIIKSYSKHWHHSSYRCSKQQKSCYWDCLADLYQGKTTTTERMLYYSGHTRRIGGR
jgi:hypothetical protein